MRIIDISRGLMSAPVYPGDEQAKTEKITDVENGDVSGYSVITAGSHSSTHADAFSHFIMGGKTIDKMDLDHYYGKCIVVTTPENMPVYKKDMEKLAAIIGGMQ